MAIGTPTSLGSANAVTSAASLSMTVTANVAVGQFVVVAFSCAGPAQTLAVTDSAGNTWATDASSTGRSNGLGFIASCQVTNAMTSGSTTITGTTPGSSSARLICAAQVSGIATSTALDKTITANGTVVGWSTGASAATTQADELVIGVCGNDSTSTETSTPGGGFTELFDFATSSAAELTMTYLIVAATGAQTASGTWTNSGARGWNAALATYKADTAAAAASIPLLVMAPRNPA